MYIYFCGSIRGGRSDAKIYHTIVKHLKNYGNVLTEHVGSMDVDDDGKIKEDSKLTDKQIHDRDLEWLKKSEVVVAEVTTPSLGVGYEIGRAVEMNKNILCLFRIPCEKRLSAMIGGAKNASNFTVHSYKEVDDACSFVTEFFKKLEK